MTEQQMKHKLLYEYEALPILPVPEIMFQFQKGFMTFVINASFIPDQEKYAIHTKDEHGLEFIYRIPPDDHKLQKWVEYCVYNPGRHILPSLMEFGRRKDGNSFADIVGKKQTFEDIKNYKGDNLQ